MSLTQRKSRPFKRDTDSFRDDRLFIVACDDTYAPKQYFDFFKIPRIQVHVVTTPENSNDCHALDVLNRLKSIDCKEYDERWILLDTDHYIQGTHLASFTQALKEAQDIGVNIALSKPCFELWLLLHYVDIDKVIPLKNAKKVEALLRQTLNGQYNKTKLNQDDFSLLSVPSAYSKAKKLDEGNTGLIPQHNTSRVYQLWQSIIDKALPSQLPVELQSIKH